MAYYPYNSAREAVQTLGRNDRVRVDGVGAYYAEDMTHEAVEPINGLALGSAASHADVATRTIVGRRRPLMVAREWAVRVTDLAWKAPATTDELTLIQLTDAELRQVRSAAHGHEVQMVGVLTERPPSMAQAQGVFVGTPYALSEVIAVVGVADQRPIPTPLFLVTAHLRDAIDADGGRGRVGDSAQMLGGSLVYLVALPARNQRLLPPINVAIARLPSQPAAPLMPGAPPAPPSPDVVQLTAATLRGGFAQAGVLGAITTPQAVGIGALVVGLGVAALYLTRSS